MNTKYLITFIITCLMMLFWGLGAYDLTAPDEPRFALIAREMITGDHWVLLHRNDVAYSDKPPFFFWCIAIVSLIMGEVNAFTARIPSVFAAIGTLLLMYQWAKKDEDTIDEKKGILTLYVLFTSFLFFYLSRIAQIDMLMCFFVTGAMLEGYKLITGNSSSIWLMALWMGLGTITKGPIAFLLPLGTCACFLFFNRLSWKLLPWKAVLCSFIVPVIWIVFLVLEAYQKNNLDYLHDILFVQTVKRYADPWHHFQPFYYFLKTFLYDFAPWSLFFLLALFFPLKKWSGLSSKEKFSWCVCLFVILFFSLSRGKRNVYILPMFPFAAFITASYLYYFWKQEIYPRFLKILFGFFFIVFLMLGLLFIGIGLGLDFMPKQYVLNIHLPYILIFMYGSALVLISFSGFLSIKKKKLAFSTIVLIVCMMAINLVTFQIIKPVLDPQRSVRGFMEQTISITEKYEKNPVLGMVDFREGFRFYGNRHIIELNDVKGESKNGEFGVEKFWELYPEGWLIVKESHWLDYVQSSGVKGKIRYEDSIGKDKKYFLIQKQN